MGAIGWILLGSFLIAAGSVVAQYGWEARSSPFHGRGGSWKRSAMFIFAGTFAIVIGGIVVTYGWDIRSTESNRDLLTQQAQVERQLRRAAMIETLRSELRFNDEIMSSKAFTEEDERALRQQYFFPRFLTGGVNSAISSGLFVPPQDAELFEALRRFQVHAEQLNARLEAADSMMILSAQPENVVLRQNIRLGIRDGQISALLRAAQQHLKAQTANYPGSTPGLVSP